jgi:hypothetical protein
VTYRETAPLRNARYSAFGLTIESQIVLPELPRCEAEGPADVEIRFGAVEDRLDAAVEVDREVTAKPGALRMDYAPARYLVLGGREIVIAPNGSSSERDIRSYLLGSAMGAICHQRGLLPLHANAVEVAGRAIAFAGPSGAGKSTLAAYFRQAGRRLLCDDVCAISFDAAGVPMAWPGIPRIKLWGDALEAFGRDPEGLERVFDGEDKFSLPFPADPLLSAIPLARIYMLHRAAADSRSGVRPQSGAEAFNYVISNIYRREFAAPLGRSKALFDGVLALVRVTEVFTAEREWGFDKFESEARLLERHSALQDALGRRRMPSQEAVGGGRG